MADKTEKKAKSGKEELLKQIREDFRVAEEAWNALRDEMRDDYKFRSGEQWPDEIKRLREVDGRPCLTVNQMPQYIRQVVNDQKRNRPSIQVTAVDNKADPDTAIVLQGLIRNIEYTSNADLAYDTAFEQAATCGVGYFKIKTKYCDDRSFDQDIVIEPIQDVFSVYTDPLAEPFLSDARFAFIFEEKSRDDFKKQFPDSEAVSAMWDSERVGCETWVTEDTIRLAEYYYVERSTKRIVQLDNGEIMDRVDYDESVRKFGETGIQLSGTGVFQNDEPPAVPEVVAEREAEVRTVHWVLTNGLEILDETLWPGECIPIIPVVGDTYISDGKRQFEGVVRQARDPQRMYNFWVSAETESIALAPRAPFIGAAGQFENFEKQWNIANTRNLPYLEYNPVSANGQPVAAPTRNAYEAPVQAITNARALAQNDIKATTGIYDPSLGMSSREESGVAVLARQYQASTTNFHYVDNLTKSLRHAGKIIIDLIPKIYDTPRIIRITGDEERVVRVGANIEQNKDVSDYQLGIGRYDVVVQPGESNTTQRQESLKILTELAKVAPQIIGSCGDLIVGNLDIPEAAEMAARMKLMMPPELQPNGGISPKAQAMIQQIQQQAQAQIMQMQAVMQQMQVLNSELTSRANSAEAKIDSKIMETSSKERIELAKIQRDYVLEAAKIMGAKADKLLDLEIAQIENRLQQIGDDEPVQALPANAKPGTEQYVIPGINDPITELQKTQEQMRNKQASQAESALHESNVDSQGGLPQDALHPIVPATPSNLKGKGPILLGSTVERNHSKL